MILNMSFTITTTPVTFLVVILSVVMTVLHLPVTAGFTLSLERSLPVTGVDLNKLKARDLARARLHNRRLLSAGVVDFSVEGSASPFTVGLYFTRVKLGNPQKEFYVQIDTGSDILWVTCNQCSGCPSSSGLNIQLEFFDPQTSSTASMIGCEDQRCYAALQGGEAVCPASDSSSSQCSYSFQYGDGSGTSGYYVSDAMYFDTVTANEQIANSSATVLFGSCTESFLSLLKRVRQWWRHISPWRDSRTRPHYNLNLQSIAVNGQQLNIDSSVFSTSSTQGTIVDSGTTLAYLAEQAYDTFVNGIISAIQSLSVQSFDSKGNQCFVTASSADEVFPPVTLNFAGGASMYLKPSDYLIQQGSVNNAIVWCIGWQKNQGGTTILGDLVLKDKIFVYDLANQRIGWANYDCSLSVNVSSTFGKNEYVNPGQLDISTSSQHVSWRLLPMSIIVLLLHIFVLRINRL